MPTRTEYWDVTPSWWHKAGQTIGAKDEALDDKRRRWKLAGFQAIDLIGQTTRAHGIRFGRRLLEVEVAIHDPPTARCEEKASSPEEVRAMLEQLNPDL